MKKLRIHPLFLAAGILSALTGTLFLFLAAVLAALEHECAHAFAARRMGYELDRVVLMPYGAVIAGDVTGMNKKQELAVLAAGPLANLATGIFFVALWWLYPETYPFTDLAAAVSFSLFFVNLLPAYPLDGGRMLKLLLAPLGKRRANLICGAVGGLVSLAVLGYFVYSCFHTPAFTALAFAVLILAGSIGGGSYHRLTLSEKRFLHGIEERRIAIAADRPLKDGLKFLREENYLTLLLFEKGEFCGELSEEEYLRALEGGNYDAPLSEFLPSQF